MQKSPARDYSLDSPLIQPSDMMRQLLQEKSFPHYETMLVQYGGLKVDAISGPHAADRNAIHWPVQCTSMVSNRHRTLHGGIATYFIDTFGSLHVGLMTGNFMHVSVDIHMSYLRAVPIDVPLLVKTYIVKYGKSLIFLEGTIVRQDQPDEVLVSATHTKSVVPTRKSKL